MTAAAALLELQGVSFDYDSAAGRVPALRRIDLTMRAGEFQAILGPSGCGKSTLLRLIAGLHAITDGRLLWSSEQARRDLTMVFQEPTLLPWRTVMENAMFGARAWARDDDSAAAMCETLLQRFNLQAFANEYPARLSVGMQQRLALARALISRPTVLLLDEAMSGSDFSMRLRIERTLVEQLAAGASVLLVSHDLDDCLRIADRLIVLADRPASVKKVIDIPCVREERASASGTLTLRAVREEVLGLLGA